MQPRRRSRSALIAIVGLVAGAGATALGAALLALLITGFGQGDNCSSPADTTVLGPGTGRLVGATEYGGPGDPSSGTVGASGANLLQHPDSYAELGGETFETATAMGGLAYMTPLRVTWGAHSAIAYKRDFGLGGGPVDGLPRVIDLWWQLAGRLGIPYEGGQWSGPVRIERPPDAGAGQLLGQTPMAAGSGSVAGSGAPA